MLNHFYKLHRTIQSACDYEMVCTFVLYASPRNKAKAPAHCRCFAGATGGKSLAGYGQGHRERLRYASVPDLRESLVALLAAICWEIEAGWGWGRG